MPRSTTEENAGKHSKVMSARIETAKALENAKVAKLKMPKGPSCKLSRPRRGKWVGSYVAKGCRLSQVLNRGPGSSLGPCLSSSQALKGGKVSVCQCEDRWAGVKHSHTIFRWPVPYAVFTSKLGSRSVS